MHVVDVADDPERRAMCARVVAELSADFDVVTIYEGGSVPSGFGNRTSDLDLIAVLDEDDSVTRSLDFFGPTFTCDVQLLPKATLVREIHQVNTLQSAMRTVSDIRKLDVAFRNINQLQRGRALHGTSAKIDLCALVSRDRLRQLIVSNQSAIALTFVADAWGAFADGDYLTSWDASSIALRHAAEGLLAATGDYYYNSKFLLRRLKANDVTRELFPVVVESLFHPLDGDCTDVPQLLAQITSRLMVAGYCTAWAALVGWDKEITRLPPYDRISDPGVYSRSPWEVLARCDDGLFLGGREGRQLSKPAALLWALSTGGTVAELSMQFSKYAGLPEVDGRDWVDRTRAELIQAGFIEREDRLDPSFYMHYN